MSINCNQQELDHAEGIARGALSIDRLISGATSEELGCCEQLDQEGFAILLAWMRGLTDNATYLRIKMTADHLHVAGPNTMERWEELKGQSPSSIAAEIAGLVAAADIARQNGDATSALAGSRQPIRGGRTSRPGRTRRAASGEVTSTMSALMRQ
jgi:hypothetical protein